MLRLKQWLAESSTAQIELARSMGVSQPTVSDWINGNTSPTVDNLRRLSNITGMTIDELLEAPGTQRIAADNKNNLGESHGVSINQRR